MDHRERVSMMGIIDTRGLECSALMAEVNVKTACRMVPVHPDDSYLLGMQWEGSFTLTQLCHLFSVQLPIYSMHWQMQLNGCYCTRDVEKVLDTFHDLGVPVAENKLVGPSTCITFLGIEIHSVQMKLRLLEDKLERIKMLVAEWRCQRSCRKREFESVIGHLSHVCKVVRPGRRFLRGIIQL